MTKWIKVTDSINDTDWLVNLDHIEAIHKPSNTLGLSSGSFHVTRESMERVMEAIDYQDAD